MVEGKGGTQEATFRQTCSKAVLLLRSVAFKNLKCVVLCPHCKLPKEFIMP